MNEDLALGHVAIVDAAVRDEGTSYHYLPPDREISADPHAIRVLHQVAERAGARLTIGKTWTTDAFFRETRGRIARRRSEGCLVVEQEAATMLAVAQFRRVRFGRIPLRSRRRQRGDLGRAGVAGRHRCTTWALPASGRGRAGTFSSRSLTRRWQVRQEAPD